MALPDGEAFIKLWPKCFIMILTVIELIALLLLILAEFWNIAVGFWTTNVFAGSWCGVVLIIHLVFMFMSGCCFRGPKLVFITLIVSFIGAVATALLIAFNAVFLAQPTTCILTSSCQSNAVATDIFTYNFQQTAYTIFTYKAPFTSYTQTQVKALCQILELTMGCICFIICVIYIIIYYVCLKKTKPKATPRASVSPIPEKEDDEESKQQDKQASDQRNQPPSPQQVNPPPKGYPPPPQHSYPVPLPYGYPAPPQYGYPPPHQQGYPVLPQYGFPSPLGQQANYPPVPQPPYYQPSRFLQPRSGAISWIAVKKR